MVPVSGPLIQTKALAFASELGLSDFKGSNGWLDSFLKRNNIVFKTQSGERGEVNRDTVAQWKEKLPTVCEGYKPEDIFNMDETGLFYKDSSRATYFTKGESCAGGKRSKQRITVALCASMTGEKLKPLVIGKSRRPRCFGSMSTAKLPVRYEANKKAWMLTPVMDEWLQDLNKKMRAQRRKILLLLDNAPVHPRIHLTNVKLQFLPPNTTAIVQPMDAGIIQTMKLKYRKRQLLHVVNEMDKHPLKLGPVILRDISVLDAIYWLSAAWKETKEETIVKCFAKCGLTPESLSASESDCIVSEDGDASEFDPEDDLPLSVIKLSRTLFNCDVNELSVIDENLATCDTSDASFDKPVSVEDGDSDDEDEGTTETEPAPPTTCLSNTEFADFLGKAKQYALAKNHPGMLDATMHLQDLFLQCRTESTVRQGKISDFFK